MANIKLSIIIVSWNTAKLLSDCLKSLEFEIRSAKSADEIEIIVVDNGSSDDSVVVFKNLKFDIENSLKTCPEHVERIKNLKLKIIVNESNLGFARAVNQGMKLAEGGTILLLNSDTQIKPGALGKLLEFEKQVGPAIIGAKMLNPDGTVQGSCFYFPTIKRAILEYWLGKKNYFSKYAPLGKESVEVDAISGGAMLISRAVIDKVGLLDERYFMYFEDLEYCRRAGKYAFKVFYLPGAEIVHEHGASGQNSSLPENQWRRLIPSSKIYYGQIKHYLISFILWSGQKWAKIKRH